MSKPSSFVYLWLMALDPKYLNSLLEKSVKENLDLFFQVATQVLILGR